MGENREEKRRVRKRDGKGIEWNELGNETEVNP